MPGELSRANMISSHVKITCYLHMRKDHRCYGYIIIAPFAAKKYLGEIVWRLIVVYIIIEHYMAAWRYEFSLLANLEFLSRAFRISLQHVNMSNQWGLRFSSRGLRFSPWGLRFSPRGLRFSPWGLRFSPRGLRFSP